MSLAALALLLTSGLTAGCAPQLDGNNSNQIEKGTFTDANGQNREQVMMGPSNTVEDCLATATDAAVLCVDNDVDGFTSADAGNLWASDGTECHCTVDGLPLPGFPVSVSSSADLTSKYDCDDADFSVTTADVIAYTDADSDGTGDDTTMDTVCGLAADQVTVGGDCDDTDANNFPGNSEVCDGADNDCDLSADNGLTFSTWYADGDTDGYGDPAMSTSTCDGAPSGSIADNTDCDDTDGSVNPGGIEVADDGIDQDCDGSDLVTPDPDVDGDGFAASADCDDTDGAINPDAVEVLDNAIDENCDGIAEMTPTATDVDGDGYDAIADGGTDCDDTDGAINPGMVEVSLNGVSDNCSGIANSEDIVEICVTPTTDMMSTSWELFLRDGTEDWDGSTTATWDFPGANEGIGTLCASMLVVDGNVEYINGPFDVNNNGTYGEVMVDTDSDGVTDYGDGAWAFMLDTTLVDTATITANGYAITVPNVSYTTGADGRWTVNLL